MDYFEQSENCIHYNVIAMEVFFRRSPLKLHYIQSNKGALCYKPEGRGFDS
jgi:hypothetical protein